jgi:Uri superfamily endonuclease
VSNLPLYHPSLNTRLSSDHPNPPGRHPLKRQDKGTYLLVIEMKENQRISIGNRPLTNFRKGIYLYVGRAKNGLQRRIKRHLSKKKKRFWHIDYFLQKAKVQEVWIRRDFFDECQTALEVKSLLKDTSSPLKEFGASDCKCPCHLFYLPERKVCLKSLRRTLSFEKVEIHGNHA